MCARVRFSSSTHFTPWDPIGVVITVPDGLPVLLTFVAVRAVLTQLRVPQPTYGARCFCGEPIRLTPRVPQQRRSEQVVTHGA